jgi:plastocyanin
MRGRGRTTRSGRAGALAVALVLAGCGLAGCSSDSDAGAEPTSAATSPVAGSPAAPSSSASASGSAAPGPAADAVITISVRGRDVTPGPGRRRLSVGDRVHLVVTTDRDNVLHVHGVEIEENLKAGVPLGVDFVVKDPGVYPVELHEPELLLTQLVVR